MSTWIDYSRPEYPREVHEEHITADADHQPVPDEEITNCTQCHLAITGDGKRHGFDVAIYEQVVCDTWNANRDDL